MDNLVPVDLSEQHHTQEEGQQELLIPEHTLGQILQECLQPVRKRS